MAQPNSRRIVATMPATVIDVERFEDGTPKRYLVCPFGQTWAAIWVWADQVHPRTSQPVELVRTEVKL
jgi:hypothetical protein